MKHFKLTDETKINEFGVELHRIELIEDCVWGKPGKKGGWVEKEDSIVDMGWVMDYGEVFGNAMLHKQSRISDNAKVFDNAILHGAWVSGNAWIYQDARMMNHATACGKSRIYGNSKIHANVHMMGGDWEKSPIQIQGSREMIYESREGYLIIGNREYELEHWAQEYENLLRRQGYNTLEIVEYLQYINTIRYIRDLK